MKISRTAAFLFCIPACSAAVGLACSSRNQEITVESPTTDESLVAGEFRVDVDPRAGTVVFTPIESSLIGSKNFQQVAKGNIKFATPAAVWGVGNVGATSSPSPVDDGSCADNQFCARITATNLSGQTANSLWVEVTSIGGGATVVGNGDRDKGYATGSYAQSAYLDGGTQTASDYLSFAYGAFRYGDMINGKALDRNWRFDVPTGETFTFSVRVLASFIRSPYAISDGGLSVDAAAPFVAYNACDTSTGVDTPSYTLFTDNTITSTATAQSASIEFPFPVTIYGVTSTTGYILSNGVVGLGTAGSTWKTKGNHTFPMGSPDDPRSAFLPFWDALYYAKSTAKVCVANVTGASPRAVVVTWKDVHPNIIAAANINSVTTFSVVIREFSDLAEYIYFHPTLQASGDSNGVRGISATAGVVNETGQITMQVPNANGTTAFLPGPIPFPAPAYDGRYPVRILVKASADPVPCTDAGGCNGG